MPAFKKFAVAILLIGGIVVLLFGAVKSTQGQISTKEVGQSGNLNNSDAFTSSSEPATGLPNLASGGNEKSQPAGGRPGGTELTSLPSVSTGNLSTEEAAALLYMREEEKMAHDVYTRLYEKWGLAVFQNISQSEQTHMDAVKALINSYGLQDPATSEAGVFTNPDFQILYDDLTARGEQSLGEALKAGAAIEEIDIRDLVERLQTDQPDIQNTFNTLLRGSQNHLRAFVSTLSAQTGETYLPQYLDAEAYQEIINAGTQPGGNGRGGKGYQGGRP